MHPAHAITLAVVALGLAAFRYPTTVVAPAATVAPSFAISNGLPSGQNKSGFESLMITNCAYASIRVGARDISPEPLSLVRDGLAARANAALVGKHVVLSNFTLHVNNASAQRAQMGAMYTGLIPDLMNNRQKVGCAPDDLRGGFSVEELDEPTPLIVVIDLDVDGVGYHARCLRPSPFPVPPLARAKPEVHSTWDAAVTAGIVCAIDKLVSQVVSGTPVAIPAPPLSHGARAREAAAKRREAQLHASEHAESK